MCVMSERLRQAYEFGPFRVDVDERVLRRGSEVIPLRPKVFDTLLVLVRHGDHVVPKEDLLKAVWPDSFVEEGSLTQNISSLRKVLEGAEDGRKYIETVPKRGYRFVAAVREVTGGRAAKSPDDVSHEPAADGEEVEPAATSSGSSDSSEQASGEARDPAAARRRGRRFYALCAALILLASALTVLLARRLRDGEVEPPRSVAVLPFKVIGGDGNDLDGLGMSDAIALKLGGLQSPTILPSSSVFKYAGHDVEARAAGRELGVEAVLEGAVQRAGDRVRVTSQLVGVGDGRVLWSGKFDAQRNDIFSVQDSISEQVAEAILPRLTTVERDRLAKQYTRDTEAYQAYMTGVYFWNKRSKQDVTKAIDYFQQAIQKDPNYALAYAGLSDCYYLSVINLYDIIPPAEASVKEEASAFKALELDHTLSQAHLAMASVKMLHRDYDGADAEYARAIELSPNFAIARVRYAYFMFYGRRLGEAIPQLRRAQELDPVSPLTNGALGFMLTMARQSDEAVKYCRRALELDPSVISGHYNLGQALLQKGQFDEAIAEFLAMPDSQRLDSLQSLAYAYAAAGRKADAERALAELVRLHELGTERERQIVTPYNIALVYGALGDRDDAFLWIEKQRLNPISISALKYDSQLDVLRADPRFGAFLRRHNLEDLLDDSH